MSLLSDLRAQLDNKEISVRDLVDQYLAVVNEREGDLHALVDVYDAETIEKQIILSWFLYL